MTLPKRFACLFALLGSLLAASLPATLLAQSSWRKDAAEFQHHLDSEYADSATSPMRGADLAAFKTLGFFPLDKAYCVKASFVRTPDEKPFEMPTVSGKTKTFVKYGDLLFTIKGIPETLAVYQNLKLIQNPKYADDLFIPFRDQSSGEESYGGGRYMDIKLPKSKTVRLDFNQCYNPYCAYSTGWNCPIPPTENYLDLKVLAGVKAWENGH